MANRPVFSAPGKLVVAGEYAVLEGFEALSISVDRRVLVSVKDSSTPSLQESGSVVGCVVRELKERGFTLPKIDLEIDSSALHLSSDRSSMKIGLGSSSAVAVAVTSALLHELDLNPKGKLCFEMAQNAHRRFTRRRGSGIDIATSFYGGAIRFTKRLRHQIIVKPCTPTIDHRCLMVVHTGIKQSTAAYLKRVKDSKYRESQTYKEAMKGIGAAALGIIDCFTSTDSTDTMWPRLCSTVAEHNRWMDLLSQVSQINILGEAHLQINAIAEKYEGAAKPSGAGGGDITLCFIKPEHHQAFLTDLQDTPFTALALKFCVGGVASQ